MTQDDGYKAIVILQKLVDGYGDLERNNEIMLKALRKILDDPKQARNIAKAALLSAGYPVEGEEC